jgi:hypothetical protein
VDGAADPEPPAASTHGIQISYCGSPYPDTALIDKYSITRTTSLNEYAFDDATGDGTFHGNDTSNWAKRIKLTPTDHHDGMIGDWEHAKATLYPNFLSSCAGFYGSDVQMNRIMEMAKGLKAMRAARPWAKIGMYGFPYTYYNAARDGDYPWWVSQLNNARAALTLVDRYFPSMYLGYSLDKDEPLVNWQKAVVNYAHLCLAGDKPVWPFINYVWFKTSSNHAKGTRIPLWMVYENVKAWANASANAKKIAGIVIWNSSTFGDNSIDDETLATIRAALDGKSLPT